MEELAKIQRVTSVYSHAEDRFRLTGEVNAEDTRCFWLTQRLLLRLLPHLLQWLGEIAKARGDNKQDVRQAEVMQDFAQQAAKARLKPQASVPEPSADSDDIKADSDANTLQNNSWLVQEVDISKSTNGALTVTFKRSGGGGVQLGMAPIELRQWLIILHSQWRKAQWPLDLWPEWVDSSPKQGGRTPKGLH